MNITIEKENSVVTAQLEGRLDTPASLEVAPTMESLHNDAGGKVILDCTKLEYISSSGLRLFLTLRKETASKGGKVIIKNINDEIKKVFMMTGFFNLFEIV